MSKKKASMISVALAVVMAGSGTAASASPSFPCFYDDEVQSARIHELQIMLMVNALKCRDIAPVALRSYGSLVEDRGDEMSFHGDRIAQRLMERYGPQGGRMAFRDYETSLSNYHSQNRLSRQGCEELGTYVRMASMADDDGLEALSKLVTNRSIASCPATDRQWGQAASERYRAAAEPPVRVHRGILPPGASVAQMERLSQWQGEPAPVSEADGFASSAAVADPDIETGATPEPSAPDTERESLDQAIAALDSAAAALRNLRPQSADRAE